MDRFLNRLSTFKQSLSAWLLRRLDFFTPRRTIGLGAGLLAAFVVMVLLTAQAQALLPTTDDIANGAFIVLNTILFGVVQAIGEIVSLVVSLLVAVAQFNKFSTIRVVDIGWTIVKDVSNMLFIIALLVIAAGTVLRLENYRYNRLLSNLIIMAFLTNFSKFIAAFFIQGAQVLMLTFVNAFREALFGNFVAAFGLDKILQFSQTASASQLSQGEIFGNLLAGLILIVIAMIITAAILIVLVVRIVALWILVILSPLAFAMQILPNTKSFATRWWSEFGKYVTQGPILAFFLWLALAIVSVGSGAGSSTTEIANTVNATRPGPVFFASAAFDFDSLLTFLISGAFLMFGLQYATSSSGVAGKWAGKVATAGFGAAATVSGINAIRDRTVAPVQGWIKNRNAARQSAIQERTQTLEAAGDRVRASMPRMTIPGTDFGPLSQRGKEKAQASANVYERQRTQRLAQERGYGDMDEAALHTRAQNSKNPRERLAALTELQQRGKYNLRDPLQDAAFNQIMAQNRIPEGEQRKLRQSILKSNVDAIVEQGPQGEARIRQDLARSTDRDERIILAQALDRRKALDASNLGDVGITNQLLSDLNDSPEALKQYLDTLRRNNHEMAVQTIYGGLGQQAEAAERANPNRTPQSQAQALASAQESIGRYTADVQQGLVSTRPLTSRRQAEVQNTLTNLGMAQPEAQNYLVRNIVHNARTREDMDRAISGMDTDSQNTLLDGARLEYVDRATGVRHELDDDKRLALAERHFYDEAFTRLNAAGGYDFDENAAQQYATLNQEKIREGYRTRKLSNSTLQNHDLMEMYDGLGAVLEDDVKNLTLDERKRGFYGRTKIDQVRGMKQRGEDFDVTTRPGRENLKQARFLAVAGRGGDLEDAGGRNVNSLEEAFGNVPNQALTRNGNIVGQLNDAFQQFVRTNGSQLTRLDFGNLNPNYQQTIVNNINVRDLASIHDQNTQSVIDIIRQMRTDFAAMTAAGADPNTDPAYRRLVNLLNTTNGKINNSDILSGY